MSAKNTTLRNRLVGAVLKGAAATAGMIAGSGAIGGFPTIWRRISRTSSWSRSAARTRRSSDIAKQATKDLGFQSRCRPAAHDALLNRFVTQPNSVDIADMETSSCCILSSSVLHPIDLKNTSGGTRSCRSSPRASTPTAARSRPRASSRTSQYVDGPESTKFAKRPTQWANGIPTVYNADTLGIRPDIVKRPIRALARAVKSGVQRPVRDPRRALDRIMDAAMAIESRGDNQVRRQGQHDQGGDRQDHQDDFRLS